MNKVLKIANAQGFWGDRCGIAADLVNQQSDLDFLTMDYLAEVSMSILGWQQAEDSSKGYAADFIDELRALLPFWAKGAKFKLIVNAGGLNPYGCAKAAFDLIAEQNLSEILKIGVVSGDDVVSFLKAKGNYTNLDTGESIDLIRNSLVSANAYLGAKPIVDVLEKGASIVITGRVADPSLTVACAVYHYKWKWDAHDKLAGATIAGHLIECGAQVTGGISTNWLKIADPANIGYPIVEMHEDASFVITKPTNTGGAVTEQTVKEQLLYEIGDPGNYLSPDVTVSFLNLSLENDGQDRILIKGATGQPPPPTYKVSATYRDGYRAEGMLTLFGAHLREKVARLGDIVFQRVKSFGYELEDYQVECLGAGDVVLGVVQKPLNEVFKECVLRICVADHRKEAVECFSKELAPLITNGPQGITGYALGRPKLKKVFGYWPCLIDVNLLKLTSEIFQEKIQ